MIYVLAFQSKIAEWHLDQCDVNPRDRRAVTILPTTWSGAPDRVRGRILTADDEIVRLGHYQAGPHWQAVERNLDVADPDRHHGHIILAPRDREAVGPHAAMWGPIYEVVKPGEEIATPVVVARLGVDPSIVEAGTLSCDEHQLPADGPIYSFCPLCGTRTGTVRVTSWRAPRVAIVDRHGAEAMSFGPDAAQVVAAQHLPCGHYATGWCASTNPGPPGSPAPATEDPNP